MQTYLLCITSQILVYEKHDFMWYTILNDECPFKWILNHPLNLPDATLYILRDRLNLPNQSLAHIMGEIQFENF